MLPTLVGRTLPAALACAVLGACSEDACPLEPCGDVLALRLERARFEPGTWSFAIDAGPPGDPFTCSVEIENVGTASATDGCAAYRPDTGEGPSILLGEWQGVDRIEIVVSHDGRVVETVSLEPEYVREEDGCERCLQMPVVVRL